MTSKSDSRSRTSTVSVYRLRDATGRLLYVGCSKNPITRISSHLRKPWGPEIATVEIDDYPDRPTAAEVEYQFMLDEQPPYNGVLRLDTRVDLDLPPHPFIVGLAEIADRLKVERRTVDQWRFRGVLPPESWTVGGRPAWNWRDVEKWARETGRL